MSRGPPQTRTTPDTQINAILIPARESREAALKRQQEAMKAGCFEVWEYCDIMSVLENLPLDPLEPPPRLHSRDRMS
jgi:hypothetical protein